MLSIGLESIPLTICLEFILVHGCGGGGVGGGGRGGGLGGGRGGRRHPSVTLFYIM